MIVEGPNGIRVDFPEGTDPATIDRVMRGELQKGGDLAARVKGMTHEQKVEAYRTLPKDDPLVGYLARDIAQPREGETPEQAQGRAYGKLSDNPGKLSGTGSAAATYLQGAPFVGEWVDELLAKLGTGNDEKTNLRAIREGRENYQKENPWKAAGLQAAGGATGAVAALGALPWWAPASLAGQALYGGATSLAGGAAEGAISGYGAGEDPEGRAQLAQDRSLLGAALGAVTGTAAPLVAAGAAPLARGVLDWFGLSGLARQAGLSRPSHELLTRALEADGAIMPPNVQGPAVGAQRIAQAGPGAMVADVGPASAGLLDATIQSGGEAARLGRDAVESRAGQALQTANTALDQTLGTPQGIGTMETAIRQGTQNARRTAYDAAYAAPIDYSTPAGQQLEGMWRQVPEDIIRRANRLMQVRREPASAQILLRQQPDGSFLPERLPDVRQLDYITRAMNDLSMGDEGMGALGGQTDIGSGFQAFSRDIRQNLRQGVPEYGAALDTAADAIDARNALRFGERLLSPAMTRDEVATTLAGMGAAERRHAALGARSKIDEALAGVTRAASDPNMDAREAMKAVRDLSSRGSREKIAALLGPGQAEALFQQLDQAGQALNLRASTAQNSKTFARQEFGKAMSDYTNEGAINKLSSGEGINAFKAAVQNLFNTGPQGKREATDRVASEIAQFLTGQDPQGLITLIQQIAQANPANIQTARRVGVGLATPLAGAAYQTGTRSLEGRAPARAPR